MFPELHIRKWYLWTLCCKVINYVDSDHAVIHLITAEGYVNDPERSLVSYELTLVHGHDGLSKSSMLQLRLWPELPFLCVKWWYLHRNLEIFFKKECRRAAPIWRSRSNKAVAVYKRSSQTPCWSRWRWIGEIPSFGNFGGAIECHLTLGRLCTTLHYIHIYLPATHALSKSSELFDSCTSHSSNSHLQYDCAATRRTDVAGAPAAI